MGILVFFKPGSHIHMFWCVNDWYEMNWNALESSLEVFVEHELILIVWRGEQF